MNRYNGNGHDDMSMYFLALVTLTDAGDLQFHFYFSFLLWGRLGAM
jgi:hypothetical protein